MTPHLRFGIFHSPYHPPGVNPALQLRRDLELVTLVEDLGFDEMWFGEHHSGGYEIIGAPEIFMAVAAERTKRIKLGTGVISLPYHHPFMVAERILMLDHLTGGRCMFGFGPGALTSDMRMMGLDPVVVRSRLEEALEAVVALLTSDEPVTRETEWFTLKEARTNLRPLTRPHPELAVASIRSPSGPRLAGRFGASLLSLAATQSAGFEFLGQTWKLAEERAALFGNVIDRKDWRVVGAAHLASDARSAVDDSRFGLAHFMRFAAAASFFEAPDVDVEVTLASTDHETLVQGINDGGAMVIGPPELAIAQIERLYEESGGFGTFLMPIWELAEHSKVMRSLELFAEHVIPHFQGSADRQKANWDAFFTQRNDNRVAFRGAQDAMIARHQAEEQDRR